MVLLWTGISVELREVLLRDKPEAMVRASPKGTVPVMVFDDGGVIDESLDIIRWALADEPSRWFADQDVEGSFAEAERCEREFKPWLDCYKYHVRYPEQPREHYRRQAMAYLVDWNRWLTERPHPGQDLLIDVLLMPFVRQFAFVDKTWFDQMGLEPLHRWLAHWLDHPLFTSVMTKHAQWQAGQPGVVVAARSR